MDWFRKLAVRAAGWIARRSPEDDTAEELRLHQEERAAELERDGLSPQAALRQARREFGSPLLAIEDSRGAWHLGWIEDLVRDLRYGARALLRDRGFAFTAIASLALGIGVNTTMFSIATEFLFSEPSVRDASTLVSIRIGGNSHARPEEVQALRDARVFRGLAGYNEGEANWNAGDSSLRIHTFLVTPDFFQVLGVPVASGRPIAPGDSDVVILSHRFWESRLNADSGALQRKLTIDGRPRTVIGILPDDHRTLTGFGYSPDVYLPLLDEGMNVELYARLPEGTTRGAAIEHTRAVAMDLDRTHPDRYYKRAESIRVDGVAAFSRVSSNKMMPIAAFFAMLMAAVGLVLLIACINVASILLARASARRQEIAMRLSLGASRGRLIRQLLAESLLLATVATGAGFALNLVLTGSLNQVRLPLPVPIYLRIDPDWRLLLYSVAVAVGSTLMAGLLPSLEAGRPKHSAREAGSGSRLRSALVTGQVAVTFVLLAAAVLFLRNLALSSTMSPGFEVDRLVYATMRLVPERYPQAASVEPVLAATLEKVHALPGVEAAAAVKVVPFNDQETHGGTLRADGSVTRLRVKHVYNRVSPDYFRVMGIEIVAGREFSRQDTRTRVAVINRAFAARVWGEANPVGHTVQFGDGPPVTIAGLCRNSKFRALGEDDQPAVYEPYEIGDGDRRHRLEVMIRTSAPPAILHDVRTALLSLDRTAAVEVRPMSAAMGMALLPSQVGAGLLGIMGLVGLALASIGLYGVLVYGVARRVREIGLRMALGAQARDVLRLILRDTAWIVGAGIAAGAAIALLVTKPLTMFLVAGLTPADPLSYLLVAAVLIVIAIAASAAPSLRAVRVDPCEALRTE